MIIESIFFEPPHLASEGVYANFDGWELIIFKDHGMR